MAGKVTSVDRGLFTRRCVSCGYDGALLDDGRAEACAACGCDLRDRPARSYAEMEGISDLPIPVYAAPVGHDHRCAARGHGWLVFLFAALGVIMLVIYLAAAALP